MARKPIPETIRSLFSTEDVAPDDTGNKPSIEDRPAEARRVVKRISALVAEHRLASQALNVELGAPELGLVIHALRDHAKGGRGELKLDAVDELKAHCLQRLFDELVEEPSNILYTTQTSSKSVRYDAMDLSFWLECLTLLEKQST
ncbi:MAG: hypothetical protein Q7Q71_08295 [Verrucomicrobiota bacterium JB023]|nr:hypothetical protein [Verrucomicrobiota bacterium JB023]